MNKYIFKQVIGNTSQLRQAQTKQELVKMVITACANAASRSQSLILSTDGEVKCDKYHVGCVLYEDDQVIYPPSCGGTFTELDTALRESGYNLAAFTSRPSK